MALSMMVQEVVHLRQLLEKLKLKQQEGSEVFVDNESTKNPATSNSGTSEAAPEGGTNASINGEDEDGVLEDYG
ncbi:hypothetical protein GN244_ATG10606 [Phytophthora infestans]|uniref:Uncharacterized protein n=1 Tax=Phytophthora infestans TaxID=4787 RepID=A0A833S0S5_PHYIN|nr:hypothetical protein GN244_ATG10606 [Phytophthora infestans]KAF4139874.1 hypothetical protein GN958_ATG10947 [Phytophthora infestans]